MIAKNVKAEVCSASVDNKPRPDNFAIMRKPNPMIHLSIFFSSCLLPVVMFLRKCYDRLGMIWETSPHSS